MDSELVDGAELAALEAAVASADRILEERRQSTANSQPQEPWSPLRSSQTPSSTAPTSQHGRPRPLLGPQSPGKGPGRRTHVCLRAVENGRIEYRAPYNEAWIAAIKTVTGREYNSEERVWTFPLECLGEALAALHAAQAPVQATPPLVLPSIQSALPVSPPRRFGQVASSSPSPTGPPAALGSPQRYTLQNPLPVKLHAEGPDFQHRPSDRFHAASPFHQGVKEACKAVRGREYDSVRKVWVFPWSSKDELLQRLSNVQEVPINILCVPPLSLDLRTLPPTAAEPGPEGSTQGGAAAPRPSVVVSLRVYGEGRVAAECVYSTAVVAALKTVPGREYDERRRCWHFPLLQLGAATAALEAVRSVQVALDPLPPLVLRAMEATCGAEDCSDRYERLPAALEGRLMDFQRQGVRFALRRGGRALIADEMGLGKTVQAIAIAACFEEEWPLLVLVPSSLRLAWAGALVEWLGVQPADISVVMPSQGPRATREGFNLVALSKHAGPPLAGSVVIVSYDMVGRLGAELAGLAPRVVIADEAHYLKNSKAQRTAACAPLLAGAQRCVLLTGTPALARPMELFEQLKAVQPTVYARAFHEYGRRYCAGGQWGQYTGSSHLEELNALVTATAMLRRLKRDVIQQLPPKRRQQLLLQLAEKDRQPVAAVTLQLAGVRAAVARASGEAVVALKNDERQLLNKLYSESARAKLSAVQEYVELLLEAGAKFLIFAHHHDMLNGIEATLQKKKAAFIRIDGQTPAGKRQHLVDTFQTNTETQVALLAIRAAGLGLTLTAASTVVFAEMTWTPGDLVQAEDRAHRIGQADSVNVYYLHARDTIDDIIWDALQHKLGNVGRALDGQQEQLELASAAAPAPARHPAPPPHSTNSQRTLDAFLRPCSEAAASSRGPLPSDLAGVDEPAQQGQASYSEDGQGDTGPATGSASLQAWIARRAAHAAKSRPGAHQDNERGKRRLETMDGRNNTLSSQIEEKESEDLSCTNSEQSGANNSEYAEKRAKLNRSS